jgi:HEAT repeat protein
MEDSDRIARELKAVWRNPDAAVRRDVIADLTRRSPRETIEGLLDGLRDADADVRECASDCLAEVANEQVVRALKQAPRDPVTWKGVARTLAKIGTIEAVSALAEALHDSSSDVWTTASLALTDVGSAAAPALSSALKHEAPSVRARAAMALGRARVHEAIDALITATRDLDGSVRMEAVVALAALQDDRAVPALVEALNDTEESVRQSVPVALGEIGSESAIEALHRAAQHEDEGIRWIAEWQLNEMGAGTESLSFEIP